MRYRKQSMIVAPQPEPTEAGADILREGGNAVDAGIACALVQTVVDPQMCGIAGFGSCGIYLPGKKFHGYIDAHAPAPLAARPDMWANLIEGEARDGYGFILKGRVNDIGYQSICAPANLKMYYEAHKEHGSLPWSRIVEPAIHWAENGWTVRPHVHFWWADGGAFGRAPNYERTGFTAAARALYCRPDGVPKKGRRCGGQPRLRPDPAGDRQGRRRRLLFGRDREGDR
jgi:gamma-glutamyltranspeptidase/glutathione hydrolase